MIAIATQCFAPDLGGIEVLMTGLADELSNSGFDIEVFADRMRAPPSVRFERPYRIQRFGSIRPLRRLMKQRAIDHSMRASAISGIFADSWKSIAAIPRTSAPIAVLAHGTELPLDASKGKTERIRAAFARARSIIASSHYTADLAANFAGGAAKIVVVNPPIPTLPPALAPALAEIDEITAGRGPVVATLARLEPRKGVDSVLRALPALRQKHPDVVYLVGGAGEDLPRLREIATSLRVDDAAVFLGRVDDPQKKAALLTRADVYAMPSRRTGNSVEGFGIAYVEAAWYGAPALAGNDGGAADAVISEETGLLCDGGDDGKVLTALARLLEDHTLRARLSAAAAVRARTQVWSAVLPRYLAAIGR